MLVDFRTQLTLESPKDDIVSAAELVNKLSRSLPDNSGRETFLLPDTDLSLRACRTTDAKSQASC